MRVNIKILRATLLTMINPFIGLLASLLSIKEGAKNKISYLLVAIFFFTLFVKIPPMYDLNIRYLEIMSIRDNFGLIFLEFQDFLLYVFSFFILKLGLPFYVIPSFFMGLMIYLYLRSINNFFCKYQTKKYGGNRFILVIFFGLLLINYVGFGLGIRYGTAMFLFIYAVICSINKEYKKSNILILFSVLMHFSMFIPLFALVLSRFIVINKWVALSLAIFLMFFSDVIGVGFIKQINFFGIGEHASIYVDGIWSQSSENTNLRLPEIITKTFISFLILCMIVSKEKLDEFDNICYLMLVVSSFFYISHTTFGRYLTLLSYLLIIRQLYCWFVNSNNYYFKNFKLFSKCIMILLIGYTFIFSNLYINRRVYELGKMWEVLYIPLQVQIVRHSQSDFENYFNFLDRDGYWIQSGQQKTK